MVRVICLLAGLLFSLWNGIAVAAEGGRNLAIKPAAAERRLALVIGNDSYQHVNALRNARADARAIAKGLADTGFDVTLKLDLSEKGMKETLRAFKARLGGGDVAVFYFAGHGVQLGAANYLLPTDIRGDNEEQVRDEAIPLQRVLDDLQEQKAKFALTIVDACRNNPFKSHGRAIGGRGLAPTTAATGQMVLFSAGAGQEALDRVGPNDRHPNGLFTRVLLKEIERPGLSADRVLRNVREEVVKIARTINHEQVPALYDQVVGEFYFRPPNANVGAGGTAPAGAARLPTDAELEQALWESIRDSTVAAPVEEYLRQYPAGRYVPHARVLLAKLRATPAQAAPTAPAPRLALAAPTPGPAARAEPAASLAPPDTGYPSRPIRIIVPFAAGGSSDIVARTFAQQLSQASGQPVIIENRAGAGGTIGSDAVTKASPDGYTLLLGTTATLAIAPATQARLAYNAQRDFLPIALLADTPLVLVTSTALPYHSAADLVRDARQRPGAVNFASSGVGSLPHLQGELFAARAGIKVVHIPYRGSAPALADLIAGHVQFAFSENASVEPMRRAGKLRALAVASERRSPAMPDVPTLAEAGIAGAPASNWYGLLAPAGTPAGIASRLNQLTRTALQATELRDRFSTMGMEQAATQTPAGFGALLRADIEKWAALAASAGIKAD